MRLAVPLLACALGGCAVLAPSAAQLERMKREAASGDRGAVAAETITCGSGQPECAQLHLLRGDACFGLAQRADTSSRRSLDRCAAEELAAGLDGLTAEQTPLGTRRDYAVKHLEALHDLIDTRTAGDASDAPALATAAAALGRRYPVDPAGPYYLASAELGMAQDRFFADGDKGALCAALRSVAPHGNAPQGAFAANFRQLDLSLRGMQEAGECP
jgi:hypothetical protein